MVCASSSVSVHQCLQLARRPRCEYLFDRALLTFGQDDRLTLGFIPQRMHLRLDLIHGEGHGNGGDTAE
jgi:hypothetical protein